MKFNGKNISIGNNVKLGKNVRIGDNTVIYDNVEIAENTTISNDCVIGEPAANYYFSKNYKNPKTKIGANSLIRSHTIIYASVVTGTNFNTGHRVTIREKSKFGNYCRLHSSVHICQHSEIGNFVFIYPFVVFTNDPHPPSTVWKGPKIGDYTQIAVSSIINSGVEIGTNCLVAANSFVKTDMPDFSVFGGSPAEKITDIRQIKSKQIKGMHYPWMNNFNKGMPWEKIGFNKWQKKQNG